MGNILATEAAPAAHVPQGKRNKNILLIIDPQVSVIGVGLKKIFLHQQSDLEKG